MQYKCKPIYLATLLALYGSFSYAAGEEVTLGEIVVSGSRAATKLSETPQAIGVVKNEAIQRDKVNNMGEVINRIPGVYWNDLGNEQHSMGIRQPISTNSVYSYLEDGIPIRPLGVFNHNSLNEMNINGTDSVEVVKGAASSLYGSNAVGGAVNFLTAKPSLTPTATLGARMDHRLGYSRFDTGASNTFGDLGLRFSHYSSRREENNWQEYSKGSKDSFTLRGDYALNSTSILRATITHTNLDAAMTGSLFENDYRNNPGKSINTFTYRKDLTTRATVAWEGETTQNGLTTATLFWRNNDHGQIPSYTITNCTSGTCAGKVTGTINNNHVDSIGLDLKHQQEFAWLGSRLVAGIYLDKSDNEYVSDNLRINRDPVTGKYLSYTLASALDPRGVRDYKAKIDNTAYFAQWEFSPISQARLVLGGRSDSIRYDFTNNLSPAGSSNFGAPNESRSFSHFSPKIGGTYAFSKQTSVYSNISEGFTPPEISQLYGKTGIPNLKPAIYDNYEIGVRSAFFDNTLKLDAALYRLDGRDTIVSYTIAPGNSENRNAGKTRSEGVELGLGWEAGRYDARLATTIANHKYQSYKLSSTLDYSGKEMPQAPSDITSIAVGYRPIEAARVAIEVVHLGKYWMDNANTVRYPGHTLLNLRFNYEFAKGWEAWIHARNLTNKRYADSASSSYSGVGTYNPNTQNQYSPGSPASILVGLRYTFSAK